MGVELPDCLSGWWSRTSLRYDFFSSASCRDQRQAKAARERGSGNERCSWAIPLRFGLDQRMNERRAASSDSPSTSYSSVCAMASRR